MKKYFTFGLVISMVSGACFAQHPMIAQLISEKQAKMEKLEKCQGTTKNLKVAGISTLGITAVGVGANIAEAVVLKNTKEDVEKAQKARDAQQTIKDKRECEQDSTKIWQDDECKDKPVIVEKEEKNPEADKNGDDKEGQKPGVPGDSAPTENESDKAFRSACSGAGYTPKDNKGEISCHAKDADMVESVDKAKELAKEKITSCLAELANETGSLFAVYCGKGALDHRFYVKKKAKTTNKPIVELPKIVEPDDGYATRQQDCSKLQDWDGSSCIDKRKEYIDVPVEFTEDQVEAYITDNQTCKNPSEGDGIISAKYFGQNTYEVVCRKSTVYYLKFKEFTEQVENNRKISPTGLLNQYFKEALAICQGGGYGIKGALVADGSGYHHCSGIDQTQCETLNTKDPYIRFVYADVPGHGTKCWVFHE